MKTAKTAGPQDGHTRDDRRHPLWMGRHRARVIRLVLFLAMAVSGVAWADPVAAGGEADPEEKRVAKAVQAALERHGGDVNRCFERALADRLDVAGKVELAVDVGAAGKVTRALPLEHEKVSPVLLACLQQSASGWTLDGIDEGTTVILPLVFEGQLAQFSVKTADAPERGPVASHGKRRTGRASSPPFSVRLLVDEATMRARQASLSLLTLAPANRIAMHRHPGAEILYIRKGRARVLGPAGTAPQTLAEGTAIFIPPGMPHALENMVRTAPVEALEVFAPLGPERVYRDPNDETGRAAFEVIHDARAAKLPAPGAAFVVAERDRVPTTPSSAGRGIKTRVFFDPAKTGSQTVSLELWDIAAGTSVPRHAHDAAEILYVLSGSGEVTVGSEPVPFGPDQAIHIPENQAHAIKAKSEVVLLRIMAPAAQDFSSKGHGKSSAAARNKVPAQP